MGISLILYLLNNLILEHKTRIQKCLIIRHKLPLNTLPHVVGLTVIVVAVEDVPALHECRVLGQHGILHVLEVVFCHLIVHLILEVLQVYRNFALFAVLL